MSKEKIELTLTIPLSKNDISDIIVTALEGGINYWAKSARPENNDYSGADFASDVIGEGGTLIIVPDEDSGEEPKELNLENFKIGLAKWMTEQGRLDLVGGVIDTGCIDADDADQIIQFALFGEIIYG